MFMFSPLRHRQPGFHPSSEKDKNRLGKRSEINDVRQSFKMQLMAVPVPETTSGISIPDMSREKVAYAGRG
jgi:hypothetical protein